MTASANIKTPTMEVPVRSGRKALKQAKKLKIKFARVTLSQVNFSCKLFVRILIVLFIYSMYYGLSYGNRYCNLWKCGRRCQQKKLVRGK